MRYVIIGNGAAGNAAAEAIRRRDAQGEVIILSDERHASYYRPLIPYLLYDAPEGQNLYRDALHTPREATVRLSSPVQAILPQIQQVLLENEKPLSYDRLLLATGASPIRPPIAGLDGPGVYSVRKLDDILAIKAAASHAGSAVIAGGGRIGVKTALALRHLGLAVTILEMLDWIIPLQLDAEAAGIIHAALRDQGIDLRFGRRVEQVIRDGERVRYVELEDGTQLGADLVVVATGVRANIELAQAAGLATRRGVLVNTRLQTSSPAIYAAGDVVETSDVVTGEPIVSGIWTNAVAMGQVAGENMAGGKREYAGAFSVLNAMDVAGIPVISAGVIQPASDRESAYASRSGGTYRKLVFRDNVLVGLLLVGDIARAGLYTALIREHYDLGVDKEAVVQGSYRYSHRLRTLQPDTNAYAA